jgi:FecR protein
MRIPAGAHVRPLPTKASMNKQWFAIAAAVTVLTSCGGGTSAAPATIAEQAASSLAATTSAVATTAAVTTAAPATTTLATTTTAAPQAATLTATGTVTVAVDGGAPTSASGPVELAAGSSVNTTDGEALVTYDDGSLLRLDANTTVLFDGQSRGSLASGRVWARVAAQDGSGSYRIDTPDGAVTATGTAFVVNCPSGETCSVTVVEGSVDVTVDAVTTAAEAPSTLAIGDKASRPANWDNVFGDSWVLAAANADSDLGWDGAIDLATAIGPAFASVGGTFVGTRTVTACAPANANVCINTPVGNVGDRTYQLSVDCAGGFPCAGKALTQYQSAEGEPLESLVDLEFDGTSYSWGFVDDGLTLCALDSDGDGTTDAALGDGSVTLSWTLTPTKAAVGADGVYAATTATGVVTAKQSVSVAASSLDDRCPEYIGGTQEAAIDVNRLS